MHCFIIDTAVYVTIMYLTRVGHLQSPIFLSPELEDVREAFPHHPLGHGNKEEWDAAMLRSLDTVQMDTQHSPSNKISLNYSGKWVRMRRSQLSHSANTCTTAALPHVDHGHVISTEWMLSNGTATAACQWAAWAHSVCLTMLCLLLCFVLLVSGALWLSLKTTHRMLFKNKNMLFKKKPQKSPHLKCMFFPGVVYPDTQGIFLVVSCIVQAARQSDKS